MSFFASARAYLDKLGQAEYREQFRQHTKRGRSAKTFRYSPSAYHCQLVELLGQDDEEGFKALKMQMGYSSDYGC